MSSMWVLLTSDFFFFKPDLLEQIYYTFQFQVTHLICKKTKNWRRNKDIRVMSSWWPFRSQIRLSLTRWSHLFWKSNLLEEKKTNYCTLPYRINHTNTQTHKKANTEDILSGFHDFSSFNLLTRIGPTITIEYFHIGLLLDRFLIIGWRKTSWSSERVSSAFTFVCLCICVSTRYRAHLLTQEPNVLVEWSLGHDKETHVFPKFSFLRFLYLHRIYSKSGKERTFQETSTCNNIIASRAHSFNVWSRSG